MGDVGAVPCEPPQLGGFSPGAISFLLLIFLLVTPPPTCCLLASSATSSLCSQFEAQLCLTWWRRWGWGGVIDDLIGQRNLTVSRQSCQLATSLQRAVMYSDSSRMQGATWCRRWSRGSGTLGLVVALLFSSAGHVTRASFYLVATIVSTRSTGRCATRLHGGAAYKSFLKPVRFVFAVFQIRTI